MPAKEYVWDGIKTWQPQYPDDETPPVPPQEVTRDNLIPGTYKPTAATVGPLPGTQFTIVTAITAASAAGRTWNGYDFRNGVTIMARNQVFKNCIFRGDTAGGGAVRGHSAVGGGLGGAQFIDCTFEQQFRQNYAANGVNNGEFSLLRCEVDGWVDGVSLTGALPNSSIQGCWIHNGTYGPQPAQSDGWTHNDAIQFHRGKNITIRGNYIGGARIAGNPTLSDDYNNACIMLKQEVSALAVDKIENVLIENNWFEGGASGINIYPDKGNNFSSVTIRNNRFVRRPSNIPQNYILQNPGWAGTMTGNVMDDTGLPVNITGD